MGKKEDKIKCLGFFVCKDMIHLFSSFTRKVSMKFFKRAAWKETEASEGEVVFRHTIWLSAE